MTTPHEAINRTTADELLQAFLADKSMNTAEAYRADLQDLAVFLKRGSVSEVVELLLTTPQGALNMLLDRYKSDLVGRCSSATANRRLAAVLSLVATARRYGLTAAEPDIRRVRVSPTGKTHTPDFESICALVEALEQKQDRLSIRDAALFRLCLEGLRRAEISSLDLSHVRGNMLWILGKGHTEREPWHLAELGYRALRRWIAVRGIAPGALFVGLNSEWCTTRLSPHGIYKAITRRGRQTGLEIRPHLLRRLAINRVLDLCGESGIDPTQVLAFSRHADLRTLMTYRDIAADSQLKLSSMLAASAKGAAGNETTAFLITESKTKKKEDQ